MYFSGKTLLVIFGVAICINALSVENFNVTNPPPMMNSIKTTKIPITEGDWTFDVITKVEGDKKTVTSAITYYSGKTKSVVIVPSILGGAPVTKISSQAFGHHGEINAVYVPSSVEEIGDWAFYDLNTAAFISFANPQVKIDDSAFQSSGNAKLYLPSNTLLKNAGGKEVFTNNTEEISLKINNPTNVIIGGGNYLNISGSPYTITLKDISDMAKGTGNIIYNSDSLTFNGEAYIPKEQKIEIYKDFQKIFSISDLNKTFKSFTKEEALKENLKISKDSSYKDVKSVIKFEEGYYVNGNKVLLDENIKAYDIVSGEAISKDEKTNLFPSTGKGKYKYIFYKDKDNDGDIDTIYYSPYEQNYSYNSTKIESDITNLNGLGARDIMNPLYLSFANGVIEANGKNFSIYKDELNIITSKDGDKISAKNNEERSLLWANDYGTIKINKMNGTSSSTGNWAKMSYESSLPAYNVEIIMEWGMNALLYATNGGTIKVGNLNGGISTFTANGDGANGIIAGGTGIKDESSYGLAETSKVYVYNSTFDLQGWNNHVADVVYGGYAYLEKVASTTGKNGSYSVGQASALANDFGNGVVEVKDFKTITYGNRSAGAYVIGGGIISAENSSFSSIMDAGLVTASGGTFKVKDSSVIGQIAVRNRGGITKDSISTFENSSFKVIKSFDNFNTGEKAKKALELWKEASGSENLIHFMMSNPSTTLGKLFDNYNIDDINQKKLLDGLSEISNIKYTRETLLRNSLLDNTFYNYSAGKFVGSTDFSEIPYLTVGSSFGGLVSSIIEFESAGVTLTFNNSKFDNLNGNDFNYLIASEAGSSGKVIFNNSDSKGIIWNEGNVFRVVEGRPDNRSSSLEVVFNNSNFQGVFADGDNGLWNVETLEYQNYNNKTSSLNGNYYGATGNFGISAIFSEGSLWNITGKSYLGKLTIEKNSKIVAPEGFLVKMIVNGLDTPIKEGIYEGQIVLELVKK